MSSKPPRVARLLPSDPGVYRFCDADGRVLYVGRASNLRDRVASYWSDLRDRGHLRPMVEVIDRVEAVVCESRHEAAWLERSLLEVQLPRWNRTAGGEEAVVYVRLDQRERSAELSVETGVAVAVEGVRWFGPYLGGVQVRRAVAALRRLFPVDYTAGGIGAAERALAAQRGVEPGDRTGFVAAIAAVLDRDVAAVGSMCGVLEREREQAAATRRYELAGRVQRELEAIAWVTAPQRVARIEPVGIDAHGWADGVLVSFVMRGGRVRLWSQQRVSLDDAEPLLAATPCDWRGFTERNAALAARLTSG